VARPASRLDGSPWARDDAPVMTSDLIGREHEIGIVDGLVHDAKDHGAALVVTGEAGIGKSSLLARARGQATDRGMLVLTTTGLQSETHFPFAGLHLLLRPIFAGVDELPTPQHAALLSAFGMTEATAPDQFLIGLAALSLLGDAATDSALLVLVEDAQWLDRATCDVLTFVARRLEAEPIVALIAVREGYESPFLEARLPELRLMRLDQTSADALLDMQAPDLAPAIRQQLLDEAAGNPLALVELPRGLGFGEPTVGSLLSADLPLSARLEQSFALRVGELPPANRTLLLVAAVDDQGHLGVVVKAASIVDGANYSVDALGPAVAARPLEIEGTELRFRHPLVRSAIRQAASVAEQHAAHTALALVLADEPDRRAWHRAASLIEPDEGVASELETAADRALARGAPAAAATALERAAHITDRPSNRGRLLVRAAEIEDRARTCRGRRSAPERGEASRTRAVRASTADPMARGAERRQLVGCGESGGLRRDREQDDRRERTRTRIEIAPNRRHRLLVGESDPGDTRSRRQCGGTDPSCPGARTLRQGRDPATALSPVPS
jgi:hypothetical protein